jgi:hypothetical protein
MLHLMSEVGTWLAESDQASRRVWGAHLLEDWRSLELMADRFD